jgi:hypothetical protein
VSLVLHVPLNVCMGDVAATPEPADYLSAQDVVWDTRALRVGLATYRAIPSLNQNQKYFPVTFSVSEMTPDCGVRPLECGALHDCAV